MREGLKEAHRDQSGAVMMTGLGMACFLIGALWFIIGVGDAIVFRDTMQETADHAAALVARGRAVAAGYDWSTTADRFAALLSRIATSVT